MQKNISAIFICLFTGLFSYGQIGFGTTTPNSTLQVAGATAINLRAFTGNTTAATTDYTLVFTGATAATVTLPDATGCTGRVYWIKNASTTVPTPVLTIATTSSQTLDGNAGWVLDEPNEAVRVLSSGANWYVQNQDVPVRKTTAVGSAWNQGGNNLTAAKSLGTISNYNFAFITNNTEKMRLTTSGFLGLGTNNPSGKFHIVNENNDAGNEYHFDDYLNGTSITAGFYLRKSRGTVAAPQNLQSGDLISQFRFAPRYNGSLTYGGGSGLDAYYTGNGTTNSSDLRWFNNGTEIMRVNENGNVGIGTSTFSAAPERLFVDAGTTTSYNVISGKGEIDNYLQLNIQNRSSGNTASSDVVATADNGTESDKYIDMGINSSGYSSVLIPILDGINEAYLFALGNDFKIGNGSAGYDLGFFTNGFTTANERLRILSGGNVGIGVTNPADKLSVAGILSPSADNTYTIGKNGARWSAVWSANGTIQTSDERLKTNIRPLTYGTEEVMGMQPVSYNWKESPDENHKIGLLAQDLKNIIPEVVAGDERRETLGMNYAELVPVLVNTIKEQQKKLVELKKELARLKKQLR